MCYFLNNNHSPSLHIKIDMGRSHVRSCGPCSPYFDCHQCLRHGKWQYCAKFPLLHGWCSLCLSAWDIRPHSKTTAYTHAQYYSTSLHVSPFFAFRTRSPFLFLKVILCVVYCIPSNIYTLINFASFVSWLFYGLTFVATLCCKWTKKDAYRVINVSCTLDLLYVVVLIILGPYSYSYSQYLHCHLPSFNTCCCRSKHRLSRGSHTYPSWFSFILSICLSQNRIPIHE